MASFRIPRLVGKTNAAGVTLWYWQPSATRRAQGWEAQALGQAHGEDPPDHIVAACRALNQRVDGGEAPAPARAAAQPLTVAQGLDAYVAAGFPSVKEPGKSVSGGTARQYKSKIKVLRAWAGDSRLRSVTSDNVAVLRDALMFPVAGDDLPKGTRIEKGRSTPYQARLPNGAIVPVDDSQLVVRHHHAHETLRVGRTLFAWFAQKRWIPRGSNPFEDFALAAPDPRDQIWWPPAREAVIAAAELADDPGMALAIDLAFSIGQREGDMLRLAVRQYAEIPQYKMDPDVFEALSKVPVPAWRGRAGYIPGDVWGIRVKQSKTGRWVEVPVVGLTRARIEHQVAAALEAGRTLILADARSGLPWTMPSPATGQQYFIRRFAELRGDAIAAATAAGDAELAQEIAGLQYRDFRRTAVVHQGELGISDINIAAVTGHNLDEVRKILETYMPRTTGSAARAIALRLERAPAAAASQEKSA